MRLVVDTNVLFSFFWKKSITRQILLKTGLELFSPEFALEEINLHKAEIMEKTGLSGSEFRSVRNDVAIAVNFIPMENYRQLIKPAALFSPDSNDLDFIALAMKMELPLWSNDSLLKNQNKVVVVSTAELLEKPEFADILFPD